MNKIKACTLRFVLCLVINGWVGLQASVLLPRNGFVSKPRVASTLECLGDYVQPGTGCGAGRNPFRVGKQTSRIPGLKQPWALRRNRFAIYDAYSNSFIV
jgi:hypothetical protein